MSYKTGGGECPVIENEELYQKIIPDSHATVTPLKLVKVERMGLQ